MPISQNYNRPLPPTVISETMLRGVDSAMPNILRHDITWSARIPRTAHEATTIHESDIDSFFASIAGHKGFNQVVLEAFSAEKDTSFYLYCEPGSSLEYDCPNELREEVARFAHTIQSMFNDARRWTHWMPLLGAPKFAIGHQTPAFWQRFNWQGIGEKVIADWIARAGSFCAGVAVGVAVGRFAF